MSVSMARTSKRSTNTSTRNARSAIEERTRAGAPPAISMPNVSPADSARSVRNCRSVSSPALRPPEPSTRVSSAPESQKSRSCEGSMITHASHTLPSSHSRCRMVRARSEAGSKRELSSPSARSMMSSSRRGSRGMRMGKSSSRVRNCFAASSSASSTRSRICRSKCTLQTNTDGGVSTTGRLSFGADGGHGVRHEGTKTTEDARRNPAAIGINALVGRGGRTGASVASPANGRRVVSRVTGGSRAPWYSCGCSRSPGDSRYGPRKARRDRPCRAVTAASSCVFVRFVPSCRTPLPP